MNAIETLDQVSAPWLEATLARRFPGVKVRGFRFGTIIRGMATKAQLHLDYAADGGAPESMWLKGDFESHGSRVPLLYAAEACFYRDLAPRLPVNCPAAYFADCEADGAHPILLLEDLTTRNARFGKAGEALSVVEAEQVLDQLAPLAALPQRAPNLVHDLPWLAQPATIDLADTVGEYFGYWDTASRNPRFDKLPPALREKPKMLATLRSLRAHDQGGPRANLMHGDCHAGNMFFEPSGSVGLLDWQTVMLGHWSSDVAYFLTVGLTVEDRRAHEVRLLKHYLQRLADAGGEAPGFDEAWLAYRRRAAWAFLTALCPVELHPEAACCAWAERAGAAITDLGTVEALAA